MATITLAGQIYEIKKLTLRDLRDFQLGLQDSVIKDADAGLPPPPKGGGEVAGTDAPSVAELKRSREREEEAWNRMVDVVARATSRTDKPLSPDDIYGLDGTLDELSAAYAQVLSLSGLVTSRGEDQAAAATQ